VNDGLAREMHGLCGGCDCPVDAATKTVTPPACCDTLQIDASSRIRRAVQDLRWVPGYRMPMDPAPNTWGYKERLVDELFSELDGRPARVLDLGCGTGQIFVDVLRRHSNVAYTGVDQDGYALRHARDTIGKYDNVTLNAGFGEAFSGDGFDLVLSLSVLEHVKRLKPFLATSVGLTKPGGRIVHRYDLGHALTPSTQGERLRVAVARRLPVVVPASRFTTYPDQRTVVDQLRNLEIDGITVTQCQMPCLKAAMNHIDPTASTSAALAQRIIDLEADLWETVGRSLPDEQRDRLFPTVTISGYRRALRRSGRVY